MCKESIPLLLGLCRSVGRCPTKNDSKESLFLKLFPVKHTPPKCDLSQEQPNEYDNYLSIINNRRSMSKSCSANSNEFKNSIRKENLFYDLNGMSLFNIFVKFVKVYYF